MTFLFGCYAGGLGEGADGLITPGPPERADKITPALDELHGDHPFLVRGYVQFPGGVVPEAPPRPQQYVTADRKLDLVVCFRQEGEDLTAWLEYLRELLRTHGDDLAFLQVAEEAHSAAPGGDGRSPAVRQAIVEGVQAAKAEARELGLSVGIGCNSTPIFDPEQEFWTDLGRRGSPGFTDSLDYVGLDFFPDVFRRIPDGKLVDAVRAVLTGFREQSLAAARIAPTVPIHITENGWATGSGRSYARHAEVVEAVVRTVVELAEPLNITAYEHFALRDADSDADDPYHQLGLLRSDYEPKPAFAVYQRLVAEFTS